MNIDLPRPKGQGRGAMIKSRLFEIQQSLRIIERMNRRRSAYCCEACPGVVFKRYNTVSRIPSHVSAVALQYGRKNGIVAKGI